MKVASRFALLVTLLVGVGARAQEALVSGKILNDETGEAIAGASVSLKAQGVGALTNERGEFEFRAKRAGKDSLVVSALGFERIALACDIDENGARFAIRLTRKAYQAREVVVESEKGNRFGVSKLASVEGTAIYEAKKNEVITLKDIAANVAFNNARQTFAKVSGLNIWQSDGGGIQLDIGGRGLSPKRTSNFNVRQNGYDISPDPLGYPESYYTPPFEALERIEVVRGAASLQYGTQFGGMLNFVFKRGAPDKPFEFLSRQSAGSFGMFNSFNSVGGTIRNFNYYGFYQFKRGDGWRPFSEFDQHVAHVSTRYAFGEKLSLSSDYTFMHYLARQPGGLTDAQFAQNPRQSLRPRNWFEVDWNVASISADYFFSSTTQLNSRFYGLMSGRQSLGNLERITYNDLTPRRDGTFNRTLIQGKFKFIANETRLIHRYDFLGNKSTVLVGIRAFRGETTQRQGDADSTANPNFQFLNPNDPDNSDYRFPNRNYSAFVENIFVVAPNFTITPGMRYENIQTSAEGYYRQISYDGAGNVVGKLRVDERRSRNRAFVLFGIGASFTPNESAELYANVSQNYRSVTFSDLRVVNPNFVIDPNIQDERGYNADLGLRGNYKGLIYYDLTLFYLRYDNQIGLLLKNDQPPLFLPYRLRTNVADSRTYGVETLIEADLYGLIFGQNPATSVSLFSNVAFLDARYINSDEPSIRNRKVELVPPITIRAGATLRRKGFQATLQFSYTGEHFTDATNAVRTSTAVNGVIPSYGVWDVSARYEIGAFAFEGGINNLTNNFYFTRRAESYPGPGIIPADGRSVYATLGMRL
ncbi:MAG: TonB-dependent receptor [Chloroherpetonaceae bacterium]|nr:TonB-dependent receptor [Chloroherpetonaceae bacterium]MDW8437211.1 TonB-dependent receptor [Chloroherpetonaceae bacterium]